MLPRDINEALCDSLGIDFVDMRETEISDDVLSMLDENIMRKYTLVPLGDAPDNPGNQGLPWLILLIFLPWMTLIL